MQIFIIEQIQKKLITNFSLNSNNPTFGLFLAHFFFFFFFFLGGGGAQNYKVF